MHRDLAIIEGIAHQITFLANPLIHFYFTLHITIHQVIQLLTSSPRLLFLCSKFLYFCHISLLLALPHSHPPLPLMQAICKLHAREKGLHI